MLPLRAILTIVFTFFLLVGSLMAQVFEVSGGASSLYQVEGANLTIHGLNYDVTTGLGLAGGHLMEGLQVVRATSYGRYLGGDLRIPFRLPTDVFDGSHYLLARGVGASINHDEGEVLLFAGATSTDYSSPYFDGAKTKEAAGMIFARQSLGKSWTLFSDTILTGRITSIAAAQWKPSPKLNLALAAGEGSGAPYAAASLDLREPTLDFKAAYIAASTNFHRVLRQSQLLAEPARLNATATYKPVSFLSLSGGHQEYLVPTSSSDANLHSQVNQAGVGLRLLGTQCNGSVYSSNFHESSGLQVMNHAVALTATRKLWTRYHVSTSYLMSRPHNARAFSSLVSTFSEVISPRITVTESVSHASGNTSVNFGGEFLSNYFTVSASYETIYVPTNTSRPFEEALMLDGKLNVFRKLSLHVSSGVDPMGRVRYTADARTVLSMAHAETPTIEHVGLGRYVLRGCVKTSTGTPIEGAAVELDGKVLYTDSTGCFADRETKQRTHTLRLRPAEFLADGNWAVTSQPANITSAAEEERAKPANLLIVDRVTPAAPPAPVGEGLQQ